MAQGSAEPDAATVVLQRHTDAGGPIPKGPGAQLYRDRKRHRAPPIAAASMGKHQDSCGPRVRFVLSPRAMRGQRPLRLGLVSVLQGGVNHDPLASCLVHAILGVCARAPRLRAGGVASGGGATGEFWDWRALLPQGRLAKSKRFCGCRVCFVVVSRALWGLESMALGLGLVSARQRRVNHDPLASCLVHAILGLCARAARQRPEIPAAGRTGGLASPTP
jgi:hypothetical protein